MLAKSHAKLSATIGSFGYYTYLGTQVHGLSFSDLHKLPGLMTAGEVLMSVLVAGVVAGFALLPDLDSPGATLPQRIWPIGPPIARIAGFLFGGHRKGTHSFIAGIPITGAACYIGAMYRPEIMAIVFALAFYVAATFTIGKKGFVVTAIGTMATWAIAAYSGVTPIAAVLLSAGGMALHAKEDMLTDGKVYFLWPLPIKFSLGLFKTGGKFENSSLFQGTLNLFLVISQVICVLLPVGSLLVGQVTR